MQSFQHANTLRKEEVNGRYDLTGANTDLFLVHCKGITLPTATVWLSNNVTIDLVFFTSILTLAHVL